jgi:bacillithiol system protein YtxJ
MNWNTLTEMAQLDAIDRESAIRKVMIFKHSTRCGTSDVAKARIERSWNDESEKLISPYYLDLVAYRSISNAIEQRYGIEHESPQVLIISNGKCIFSESHFGISMAEIIGAATT